MELTNLVAVQWNLWEKSAGVVSLNLAIKYATKLTGDAWERLPEPRPRLELEVASPDGDSSTYPLGPHTSRLRLEDLELLHKIWLEMTANREYRGLHQYHVVALALRRLERELRSSNRDQVPELLQNELIYESKSERWRQHRSDKT